MTLRHASVFLQAETVLPQMLSCCHKHQVTAVPLLSCCSHISCMGLSVRGVNSV